MAIRIDTSELDQLAADLEAHHEVLAPQVRQVVERGALNIRRDARRRVRNQLSPRTHLPHYPRSITYDIEESAGSYAEAEIGPESGRRQGGMGRGVEFGSARTPPTPHLFPAYDEELPRLLKHLRRIVGEALR